MKRLAYDEVTLKGALHVPGDKSMTHRSLMLAALAKGDSYIKDPLMSRDILSTVRLCENLGVCIDRSDPYIWHVHSLGRDHFQLKQSTLNLENSGTTMRLGMGLLAGVDDQILLSGDHSLNQRPMKRVMDPLTRMGMSFQTKEHQNRPPISVQGTKNLQAIQYRLPIASAQVKSAIMLAALQAEGTSIIQEPMLTRQHTEEMLPKFGGTIFMKGNDICIPGKQQLVSSEITIPGDFSSAAFWIVAALLVPNSSIRIKNIGLSPARIGLLEAIQHMGATYEIDWIDQKQYIGTLSINHQSLHGTKISGDLIPRLIDELPLIALLATQAEGVTEVRDAKELRVKETDRIHMVTKMLKRLGADIIEYEDGFQVIGPTPLKGACVDSCGDHRIGMMLSIASLILKQGHIDLQGAEAIDVSYPTFFDDLKKLIIA